MFRFCRTFKEDTKNLGFHITFKPADLQDIINSTCAIDIMVSINTLYLFVCKIILSAETQALSNESNKNNYTISFGSKYGERRVVIIDLKFQLDFGSAQNFNSPKHFIR